jgi:hypothetical protein
MGGGAVKRSNAARSVPLVIATPVLGASETPTQGEP